MTIIVGDLVTASEFNLIRNKVFDLIKTHYGYTSPNSQNTVVTGNSNSLVAWNNLYQELTNCHIHQNNTVIPGLSPPSSGAILTANFADTLRSVADLLWISRDTVHPSQLDTQIITDVRAGNWNTTLVSSITYNFNSSQEADYYFNLGGKIQVGLSYPDITYTNPDDILWKNLFDSAISQLNISGNNAFSKVSGNSKNIYVSDSGNSIDISWIRSGATITVSIVLTPTAIISVLPTVTYTNYYSSADNGPSPYGVPSPQFFTSGIDFDNVAIAPPATRILSVSPGTLNYSFNFVTTSAESTISVTNNGNSVITVSKLELVLGESFQDLLSTPPSNSIIKWNTGGTTLSAPGTLNPGQSKIIKLSFTSTKAQALAVNGAIVIYSNNQAGVVIIPITINITQPAFVISLNPSSWTDTVTTNEAKSQVFDIITPPGMPVTSYTASINNYHNLSFGLNTSGRNGPRVVFAPTQVVNGTYVSILSVTAYSSTFGVSASVSAVMTMTKNINAGATRNLGKWRSPTAYNNSVVGLSYDVVEGVRYLTIGVGAGANGAPEISGGGSTWANVDNLGIGSDSLPNAGPALFVAPTNGAYTSFLNNYGVWFRSESNLPHNIQQTRGYTFNVPSSATYNWTFAADNNGYFAIDGNIISDRRTFVYTTTDDYGGLVEYTAPNSNAYSTNASGTVYLTAGQHTITFGITNQGGPGSFAIDISNSSVGSVWNTRFPVRNSIPYPYWAEVYRIPLSGAAATYPAGNYNVKDGGYSFGYAYGYLMGNGNICTVYDDGDGNLSISFPTTYDPSAGPAHGPTLRANTYIPWYYIRGDNISRVVQLESGDPSQTRFFLGFNLNGQVLTSIVPTPNVGYQPVFDPGYGSGFDGGGFGP